MFFHRIGISVLFEPKVSYHIDTVKIASTAYGGE
jgi:hypothetical protein